MNEQTPEKQEIGGSVGNALTRVRRRGRRLSIQDAREVCALTALRASEREACAALKIPISSWNHWKARARNTESYQQMLDALRASKIQSHMENIEKFSAKDFRASIAYLEKTIPDRYSSAAERLAVQVNVDARPMFPSADIERALELGLSTAAFTPEARAQGIIDEIKKGQRHRDHWQYVTLPGEAQRHTETGPEVKALVEAWLRGEPIVDVDVTPAETRQISNGPSPDANTVQSSSVKGQ